VGIAERSLLLLKRKKKKNHINHELIIGQSLILFIDIPKWNTSRIFRRYLIKPPNRTQAEYKVISSCLEKGIAKFSTEPMLQAQKRKKKDVGTT